MDKSQIQKRTKELLDKAEKPTEFTRGLQELLSTKPDDIILDFYAGAGTTAAVAHKMNRQWITVEQMDYVGDITVEWLKKVIGKKAENEDKLLEEIEYDTGGISKTVNWQGGGDFIYCELNRLFYGKSYNG